MDQPTPAAPEPSREPAGELDPSATSGTGERSAVSGGGSEAGSAPEDEVPAAVEPGEGAVVSAASADAGETAEPEASASPTPAVLGGGAVPDSGTESGTSPEREREPTPTPRVTPTTTPAAASTPEPTDTPEATTSPNREPEPTPTPEITPATAPESSADPAQAAADVTEAAAPASTQGTATEHLQPHSGPASVHLPAAAPPVEFDTIPLHKPKKPTPPRDPVATGIANASLLGVGYAMLNRRWLALLAGVVTLVLVVVLASVVKALWFEVVLVVWWVAVIGHGWLLAERGPRPADPGAVRGQRFVGLAFALPVILAVGLLRFDAARIEQDVADAKDAGNCAAALDALDGRWVGHRIADAPGTAEGDDTVKACGLLHQAAADLDRSLAGDPDAVRAGIDGIEEVVDEFPGHDEMARVVLAGFLDQLPTDNPCETTALTEWLDRSQDHRVLARAADAVPEIEPEALVECGDQLMSDSDWPLAREHYQQLLDQYPDHDLTTRAQEGVTAATQAIELANVRTLLAPDYAGALPEYCTSPAPYSGAPAYGSVRPDKALVYGTDEYSARLPAEWKAADPADAVLVICAQPSGYGTPVETCPYESSSPFGFTDVTFKRIAIPVRAFELRTGRLVTDVTVEIGGASCPEVLEYTSFGTVDLGPPSEVYVTPADPDVHAGFTSLINP